jgi:septum formation protein
VARPFALYLASRSPRRRELLEGLGLVPRLVSADVDEQPLPGEAGAELARRLAEAKGREALGAIEADAPPGVVLAADTVVILDGESFGKPADAAEAAAMLGRLGGRTHQVITGVFLARTDDRRSLTEAATTNVTFRALGQAEIAAYAATSEPLDKAGAYGIQGRGALLIESIAGSWTNVAGLPVERLPGWLARLDVAWDALERRALT